MTSLPPPSLTLNQCVETLKNHLACVSKTQPKELSRLYLAAVGLLCHLKKDTATLEATRDKSKNTVTGPIPCPSAQEIPAITRIHQDSSLFNALVSCLRVPDASDATADTSTTPRYDRKRSYSFQQDSDSTTPANKMLKIQHSPTKKLSSTPIMPRIPLPTLAATVLYTAFQHVDHWPVPLVQAYAEDSFGPRLWVDDERCSLLVKNLAFCHDDSEQATNIDEATLSQAARVAHYYENQPSLRHSNGSTVASRSAVYSPQPNPVKRQRSKSLGSAGDRSTAAPPPSDSDSDSGDEESCLVEVSSGLLARAGNGGGGDDSSSSGEEDMEVVEMSTTTLEGPRPSNTASLVSQSVSSTPNPLSSFPGTPASLNLDRIRRRYVGVNLDHAQKAIGTALSERLDVKSKQNSKLLMALPSFVCIPAVRRLTTRHLERWLQSPALSGQARALFAATVKKMQNVDPPLPDDLQAIESIMVMRLKANQLNMHIENVTEIAKRIPSTAVARQIFLRILREEIAIMDSGAHSSSQTEPMKMMNAVYTAFPSNLACEGLAISFLSLLAETSERDEATNGYTQRERQLYIKKIRSLVRSVAFTLGSKFDGCGLIEALLSFDVKSKSWSLEDEEDKARLMFECVTLLVPPPMADESNSRSKGQRKLHRRHSGGLSEEQITVLRSKLKRAQKLLLDWCCSEYAQQWQARHRRQEEHNKRAKKRLKRGRNDDVPSGAGVPDYGSVLDGQGDPSKFDDCLSVMRCVLFMVDSESAMLRRFLYPGDPVEVSDPAWSDVQYRIQQCYQYGANVDDDMLWIVLKSATAPDEGMESSLALSLIENLFESCSKQDKASLDFSDQRLVRELYLLAEYRPEESQGGETTENGHVPNGRNFPRLAHPGLWWRATALVLIMCGATPEGIGTDVWNEYPTLRALVKMVTSGRYRFPTIDCDEASRMEMKAGEANMRDEECQIAEALFLPPTSKPKKSESSDARTPVVRRGTRASSRQREKQERLQRLRREKEAAAALEEANRRKRTLKAAQKSIMLWDPKGPARKPPKEVVPLILSVEQLFSLSSTFRQSVNPDFLLMTIGKTTRGAIERAFEWGLPVISSFPEIINRLPANASCFLLLRAYGEEGEGKSELRKLSAPLVEHVQKSLTGEFGESSAVRAADLLLTDLSDPNPGRRRCVIRVLTETLGHLKPGDDDDSTGLLCLLQVDHAKSIVSAAIEYISQGLAFERGKTLRALVIALDKYVSFAAENKIEESWNFASILCNLISSRQIVCSEAMDRFPDFRSLAITLVHREFLAYADKKAGKTDNDSGESVLVQLCSSSSGDETASKSVSMPLTLLQSACILLSICKDEENSDVCPTARAAIQYLADTLMYPGDNHDLDSEKLAGLSSATMSSGDRAVNVEQWVMLAKSRSDFIARRAAMSAPTLFIPRLLLCSGLPASSLLTMIDRLGKLGDKAEDRGLVFKDLLSPSATNEWAAQYPGSRKEPVRKLVGRLSAYLNLNETSLDNEISSSFLEWLWEECSLQKKTKRPRTVKKSPKVDQTLLAPLLSSASGGHIVSMLGSIGQLADNDDAPKPETGAPISLEPIPPHVRQEVVTFTGPVDSNNVLAFVQKCCNENQAKALTDWLATVAMNALSEEDKQDDAAVDPVSICISLLRVLFDGKHNDKDWFTAIVLKWVPTLTQLNGRPELWTLLFSPHSTAAAVHLLRGRCALVWRQPHTKECQQWILSNYDGLCVSSILRFLIAPSYQPSIHAHTFFSSTTLSEDYWGSSESGLKAGVVIAIEGAKEPSVSNVNDPMNLPDWLIMLLLLARTGQESMMRVCGMLLATIDKEQRDEQHCSRLRSAILRLYTYYPKKMKLGNAKLRGILMEGAKSGHWLEWNSSLDSQLDDMLSSLKHNPSKRIVQALSDLSKSHPLLVLRKLPDMCKLLEDDACVPKHSNSVRGRVSGENIAGPLQARISGKSMKVNVRHWGYSFTEALWISLLDVLVCIPKEVLFSCGSQMRLGEFLSVYARLLFVQSQLRSNPARVKSKFSDLLNEFKTTDKKGWESWLASKQPELPSLDTTRNVLMSCSLITPEPSVQDLKRIMES